MPDNYNALSRIRNVFETGWVLRGGGTREHIPSPTEWTNRKSIDVWAKIFGLADAPTRKRDSVVHKMLDHLLEEVGIARQQIVASNLRSERYEQVFQDLTNQVNFEALTTLWGSYFGSITPQIIETLTLFSEIAPSDETRISEEDIRGLEALLQELYTSTSNGDLSDQAKAFIFGQIEVIENAIREYRFRGSKAFVAATGEVYSSLVLHPEGGEEVADTEQANKLKEIWGRINVMVGNAQKYANVINAGAKIVGMISGHHHYTG